jgi:hypothetical protein
MSFLIVLSIFRSKAIDHRRNTASKVIAEVGVAKKRGLAFAAVSIGEPYVEWAFSSFRFIGLAGPKIT